MSPTRKTMRSWLTAHVGSVVWPAHYRFHSIYKVQGAAGPEIWFVANKHDRLADYTRARTRRETGVNFSIWRDMHLYGERVRLALCSGGRVLVHQSRDMKKTKPDVRPVDSQETYDAGGVAWWPLSEFDVQGCPDHDPQPRAEKQPTILDFFGGDQ